MLTITVSLGNEIISRFDTKDVEMAFALRDAGFDVLVERTR